MNRLCLVVLTLVMGVGLAEPLSLGRSGLDLKGLDSTVRPQDDFYRYANGGWLRELSIGQTKARSSLHRLGAKVDEQLEAIVIEASLAETEAGTPAQMLGDLYLSFLDVHRLKELGYQPISADLKSLEELQSYADVARKMGDFHRYQVPGLVAFFTDIDAQEPKVYRLWLYQAGLSLGRSVYLEDEARNVRLRNGLKDYVEASLRAVDYPNPGQAASHVLAIESRVAQCQQTAEESRKARENYNRLTWKQLQDLTGDFDWNSYARGNGLPEMEYVVVRDYAYFEALGELFTRFSVQAWKDYLAFRLVDSHADRLSPEFDQRRFDFRGRLVNGARSRDSRPQRALIVTQGLLSEALSREYVARHFEPRVRGRVATLAQHIVEAYKSQVAGADWLGAASKTEALAKLKRLKVKVGYPDDWAPVRPVRIHPGDLVGNVRRLDQSYLVWELSRVGREAEPSDWGNHPPESVGAAYNFSQNEILIPAALLQPPIFDADAEDAVNYGALGGIIGHEIGHGFDDQGSHYDSEGNLRTWWTPEERSHFENFVDRLVGQYDGYGVNGRLTVGENMADLMGMAAAHRAYHISTKGQAPEVLDGRTPDQRFFLSWARVWRGDDDGPASDSQEHAPGRFRTIGPLQNFTPFYEAFNVVEGDQMYLPPEERLVIW